MIARALTEKVTFGRGLRERREPALLTPGAECSPEERGRGQSVQRLSGGGMASIFKEQQEGQRGSGGVRE